MTAIFRPSTWLFLLVLLVCWFVIRLDVAPTPVNDHPADTTFHVDNAVSHLQQIAHVPHSMGTAANDSVRAYIVAACRKLGLDVEERPFSLVDQWYGDALASRGINIAATLHGAPGPHNTSVPRDASASPTPTILVMAHYDSEPNALGAGDDGNACASMLETARAIRAGAPLPCDVLFLFTNGEEEGLLGAQAFSLDSTQLKHIGLILNFDGRGDAGKCLMFRTSAQNRRIVEEFARAPIHHAGASLYSELFKLLPNNTDFSPFEKTHIPGMDFAFAEGFVHYHNLSDNVENMDRRTIQEEGDNMLGAIRHFARVDGNNLLPAAPSAAPSPATPSANLAESTTYFNLLANLFIHYPPSVNFILLILTNALVLFALVSGLYRRRVYPRQAALGLLLFAGTLAILYFLSGWTLDAIRAAWPLYLGYYPNAYNANYFYLVLAAEALAVFTLVYQWPLRKWSMPSLFIAVLVFQTLVLDLIYRYIPAGVYFLYFPLIGAALLFPFLSRETPSGRAAADRTSAGRAIAGRSPSAVSPPTSAIPRQSALSLLLGALLPILFLAPLIYSLAELFDVQAEAAMVAPVTGLLLGLLIPIFSRSLRESRWLIPATALIVLLAAAGLGVLHGGHDPRGPLKTDLRYFARVDDRQAWWVSHSTKPDRWNKTFFANASLQPNAYQYAHPFPGINRELFGQAPYLDLAAPSLSIIKDSIAGSHRLLYLHCQPAKGTTTIHMSFSHDLPADGLTFMTDRSTILTSNHSAAISSNRLSGTSDRADYIAPPEDGFDLIISCKPGKPFIIDLTGRTMGLPAGAGFQAYPADVIPTAAGWANTTMVQRSYTFK